MDLKGKKVIIIGKGKSGTASGDFIKSKGGEPYFYDDYDYTGCKYKQISLATAESMSTRFDFCILCPAISANNRLVENLRAAGVPIMSELDLAYLNCASKRIIAITGTNGKTTTAMMTAKMLSSVSKVHLVGNIGTPFIEKAEDILGEDSVVVEISSFQIEQSECFRSHIAVLTNIRPDHLDRHFSMNNYIAIKHKLLDKLCVGKAVVNLDDRLCANVKCDVPKYGFSYCDERADCYFYQGNIHLKVEGNEQLIPISCLPFSGKANTYNFMSALLAATLLCGFHSEYIDVIKSFELPKYRKEYLGNVAGTDIYNDSKGTNIGATLSALCDIKGTVALILGGSDKGEDFTELFSELKSNVEVIYIIGDNAVRLMQSATLCGWDNKCRLMNSLEEVVESALESRANNILFSPASASFDRYANYKERGKHFESIISNYTARR